MSVNKVDALFWNKKRVFMTGHTGFKGGWLSLWLTSMGAIVTGYALRPNTKPSLYSVLGVNSLLENSHIADVRDFFSLQKAMIDAQPEVVIHMAAQPLVRYSYANPVETYETNIMGTVHVLEAIRKISSVRATLVITTDKCYENREQLDGYIESDAMGGYDPYSSSKGCAELITAAYRRSYFSNTGIANRLASARAGNVIGGGDWSEDRLIPDVIRAYENHEKLLIRNPLAIRPWQHVLEPLSGYLMLLQALYLHGSTYSSAWNFGPRDEDARTVLDVLNLFGTSWGVGANWTQDTLERPHEAGLLKLDCTKANRELNWHPKWSLEVAIKKIVEWQRGYERNKNMVEISLAQINEYQSNKLLH